jgi:hypothetical protein
MFMSPVGLGTKNDCTGEDQQQISRELSQGKVLKAYRAVKE